VLVDPDQQLGVHTGHELAGGANRAVLAGGVQGQAQQQRGGVLVVRLGPAEHGHQPVVDGCWCPPPAVHGQLGPQADAGVGVAGQVAGQGAFDQAGVGALAVDQEELAPAAGGDQGFAFDVGGLAAAGGAGDQPRAAVHAPGDDHQAALVGPAQVAVDPHAQRRRVGGVVAQVRGARDRGAHALARFPLGLVDLGGVDRLPAAGQVECGGQQPGGDGKGQLRPQERARCGQVDDRAAELLEEPPVAGEVVRQGRPGATLHEHHQHQGADRGEGELPPAQPGGAQQRLAGHPGENRHGAEEQQQQGDAQAGLPGAGRAAGGQPPAQLVGVQRAVVAPAGPVWPPAGVPGRPAAPAARVLRPPHAATPPAGSPARVGSSSTWTGGRPPSSRTTPPSCAARAAWRAAGT
jgi:hypothetical protein